MIADYSIVWICHNLANQSPADGYLEGFQMFAIISNVAMSILLTSYIHAHISEEKVIVTESSLYKIWDIVYKASNREFEIYVYY